VNDQSGAAEDEDELEDDIYDMEVTMEQSDVMMYAFRDFEDVIAAAGQLHSSGLTDGGRLYAYKGKYILAIEPAHVEQARYNAVIALLAEYGEATSVTY